MTTEEDVIAFLEHAGVKGMHWGVRKSRTAQTESPKERLSKINTKLEKFNAERINSGAGLIGYYQKRRQSQHPYTKAKVRLAARGAVEAAVLLGGGTIAMRKLGANPATIKGSQIALGVLAVKEIGITRVSEIYDVSVYERHTKLINEKRAIEKQLKFGK